MGEAQPTCSLVVNKLSLLYTKDTEISTFDFGATFCLRSVFEQSEVVIVFDKPYIIIFTFLS